MYEVPGKADAVSTIVKESWNNLIAAIYNSQKQRHPGTFLVLDPTSINAGAPINAVRWAANPAVPLACLDNSEEKTRALCDFGIRGRHVLHNEYSEYMVIYRTDAQGNRRPKRVILTTELREYWTTLAVYDPPYCKQLAESLVERTISWSELYGTGVSDPNTLSEDERLFRFSVEVAGDGGGLVTGVPSQPQGKLNTENILFMTHPINGLDDLIFIVMFGAKPYVVRLPDGTYREPTKFEIFGDGNALACRNADPNAALGASAQARQGVRLAFANPLGMYILTSPEELRQQFFIGDEPIPEEWIRLSRGEPGMYQRLEFGPGDDTQEFLDDIIVSRGNEDIPVKGGYDVALKVEVGPLIVLEQDPNVDPVVPREVDPIATGSGTPCSASPECSDVLALLGEFEESNP